LRADAVVGAVSAQTGDLVAELSSEAGPTRALALDTVAVVAAVGNFTFVQSQLTVSTVKAQVTRAFAVFNNSVAAAHHRTRSLCTRGPAEACEAATLAGRAAVASAVAVLRAAGGVAGLGA